MNRLALAFAAAGAAAHALVVRPWYLLWGASEDEVRKPSPGDERVLVAVTIPIGARPGTDDL
jgi:hypothetical protein